MIEVSTSTYNDVIVVGDVNVVLITVKGSCRLSTIFQDAGMEQIISASTPKIVTRCSAPLLDHVYVTHPEKIIESPYMSPYMDQVTIIRCASYTGLVALNHQNRIMTPLNTELQEFWRGWFYLRSIHYSMDAAWHVWKCRWQAGHVYELTTRTHEKLFADWAQ